MNKKDYILKGLIIISAILIIYSITYLINYYYFNDLLFHFPNNTNDKNIKLSPNEIGDSIGGTLNPVIAFTASVLTFLAFYIQYKANNEQREIFNQTNLKEKLVEHNNHKTNIKIFKILINSMISYYRESGKLLENFIKEEGENPLKMNVFSFLTNSSYENFNKLNFRDIYASITYSFENKSINWEEEFIDTLTIIDYYEKLINELKIKYEVHIRKKSKNLNSVGKVLNKNIGEILSDPHLSNFEGIDDYIAIVYNRDKNNNPIVDDDKFEGPDFFKLQNDFFQKFLKRLHDEYKKSNDEKLKNLLELYSFENKRIGTEKFQALSYVENLNKKHLNYFKNEEKFLFVEQFLDKINL